MPNEEPQSSAYNFRFVGGELNSYLFETLTEITYEVRFTPTPYLFGDDSPYAADTFELSLLVSHNPTGRKPPFDRLTARTLAVIFEDFMCVAPTLLLFTFALLMTVGKYFDNNSFTAGSIILCATILPK